MVETSLGNESQIVSGLRVVLEVTSGNYKGRKIWLRAGQVLRVGRTERSDFVIDTDANMSSEHFMLECLQRSCKVADCQSVNGTYVNHQKVSEAVLRDGDIITAGRTTFILRIEGAAALTDSQALQTVKLAEPITAKPPPKSKASPQYRVMETQSGLVGLCGDREMPTPTQIAHLLCKQAELYVIVDFRALGGPIPEELTAPRYLFDWLPGECIHDLSPVLLTRTDQEVELFDLIAKAWGQGGIVCLYSKEKVEAVHRHLLDVVHGKKKSDGPPAKGSVLGINNPAVVRTLLGFALPKTYEFFFSKFDVAFVEGDSPEEWQLFTRPEIAPRLQQLGFVPQVDDDEEEEPSEQAAAAESTE